jgi:hypothetical protein
MKDRLIYSLSQDLSAYAPIPFWSWNNELEKDELINQIHYMKDVGMGGFIIHARTGLKTKYLSNKWFKCIDACLEEAKQLKMNVFIYDENGWPSGFAGGELLKDEGNLSHYFELVESDKFDKNAYAVFVLDNENFKYINEDNNSSKYFCIYDKLDYSNTDILNKKLTAKFINSTYKLYYERYKEYIGSSFKGFFTDEPQYNRTFTAYTPVMEKDFKLSYGTDLKNNVIYLFKDSGNYKEFRFNYYKILSKLYTENFAKQIYDWCDERELQLTGHSVEESSLAYQVHCTGGVMPFYEYEHIPGIDWLGKGIGNELAQKQVASVAAQLNKKQILTETFAVTGWGIKPSRLKYIADFQYLYGVNYMCHHLLSYSLKGQGKKDYPTSFGRQLRWKEGFKIFNDYYTKLGYMNLRSAEKVNTLVLSPLTSVFTEFKEQGDEGFNYDIDNSFQKFISNLGKKQIGYHIADETILQKYGKIIDKKIIVGQIPYKYMVIPKITNLNKSTYNLITDFIAKGGKVYFENLPELVEGKKEKIYLESNIGIEDIAEDNIIQAVSGDAEYLRSAVRYSNKLNNFIYLFNTNDKNSINVHLKIAAKKLAEIDLCNLTYIEIPQKYSNRFTEISITLKPMEFKILGIAHDSDNKSITAIKENELYQKDIISDFKLIKSDDNTLTLDFAKYSFNGINYSSKMYMFQIMEKLIKDEYNGKLFIKHYFYIEKMPATMKLLFEKLEYLSIKINGYNIEYKQSDFDINFIESDIISLIKTGENAIVYEINYYQDKNVKYALYDPSVSESLRNCLVYNTELESMYLSGDFKVMFNGNCNKQNDYIMYDGEPVITWFYNKPYNKLAENGYIFFNGKQTYSAKVDLTKSRYIKVKGNFLQAEVFVDKKYAGIIMFNDTIHISGNSESVIDIIVTYSYRNMLGPHHTEIKNDIAAPFYFTFYNTWNENGSEVFKDRYLFEECKINSIKLLEE